MRPSLRISLWVVLGIVAMSSAASAESASVGGILKDAGVGGGLCVVLSAGDGALAADLAAGKRLLVHAIAADDAQARRLRRAFDKRGLAGIASVEHLQVDPLPYATNLVSLLIVQDGPAALKRGVKMAEIARVLRPGGVVCLRGPKAKLAPIRDRLVLAGLKELRVVGDGPAWLVMVKPRPAGMDDWSHPAHGPDGNPVSQDVILKAPNQLQWIVGPSWRLARAGQGPAGASARGVLSAGPRNVYLQGRNFVARDAFSGVLLWVREAPARLRMRSVLLSADAVYYCRADDVGVIDAATGRDRRPIAAAGCSQLLLDGGVLITSGRGGIRAFDVATGKEKWKDRRRAGRVLSDAGKVYWSLGGQLACLGRDDGKEVWSTDHTAAIGRRGQLAFVYRGMLLASSGARGPTTLTAISGADGSVAWSARSNKTKALAYGAAGLIWLENDTKQPRPGQPAIRTGSEIISKWIGRDPASGKVRKTTVGPVNNKYRCHTLYATDRYMITNRPLYFMDWLSGEVSGFEGTRAECGSAYLLAQGMLYGLYTNSERCMCMATVISGLTAFAPYGKTFNGEVPVETEGRLETGSSAPPASPVADDDWPMYRRDPARTASSAAKLPKMPAPVWTRKLLPAATGDSTLRYDWRVNRPHGDAITAPTVASGRAFISLTHAQQVVALDAADGKVAWRYPTPARLDAPPTIHKGLCLIGCHDGWVYCLRADDGKLVWRFRAAPAERRMVAYGQVESAWPVVGGVLVVGDTAYVLAGRTTEVDGGLYVHALDPATGKLLWSGRRRRDSDKQFGGYTPRRQQTFVGPADLLCSDGKWLSISGSNRGRFDCRTGELVRSWSKVSSFGWSPSRYRSDQNSPKTIPSCTLGKTSFIIDRKSGGVRRWARGGWISPIPRPRVVEAMVAVAGDVPAAKPKPRPVVRIRSVDRGPTVDGKIDDLYTRHAKPLTFGFLDGRKGKPKLATTGYALTDATNLYLAFRCRTPDPKKVVAVKTRRDDNVWQDECVEVFIDAANVRRELKYFHIIVNPAGVTQESRGSDNSWNPHLAARCGAEDGAWIAEVKIPLKELTGGKGAGVWSINFNRSARKPGNPSDCEDTAWSATGSSSSHVPTMFGYAWLDVLQGQAGVKDFAAWRKRIEAVTTAAARQVGGEGVILAAITNPSATPAVGELWMLSTVDGNKLGSYSLPAAPARDGLAVAGGKIYVSLQDGSVVCLGAKE